MPALDPAPRGAWLGRYAPALRTAEAVLAHRRLPGDTSPHTWVLQGNLRLLYMNHPPLSELLKNESRASGRPDLWARNSVAYAHTPEAVAVRFLVTSRAR